MVDEPDVVRLSCAFRSSIGPFFRIACSRLSSVALTSCTSSAEQPVDVSYNIDELSQAAGLARKKNVFYKEVHHSVFKVCDATFLRGSGDGNLATCEQFFFILTCWILCLHSETRRHPLVFRTRVIHGSVKLTLAIDTFCIIQGEASL